METQPTVQIPADVLLQRIDAMTRELQEMRRLILTQARPSAQTGSATNLVAQLAGALAPKPGNGQFFAYEEYDRFSDWERFANE